MYGLKQFTVLSLMLLSVTAKEAAKRTMVGVFSHDHSWPGPVAFERIPVY
jgi:hypothetical protein